MADFIFDVRCSPNPHYAKNLCDYIGLEKPIIKYFSNELMSTKMINDITHHINKWLSNFVKNGHSYFNISIDYIGGKL
jgi:UPF0042 nucleotide-binding protein